VQNSLTTQKIISSPGKKEKKDPEGGKAFKVFLLCESVFLEGFIQVSRKKWREDPRVYWELVTGREERFIEIDHLKVNI